MDHELQSLAGRCLEARYGVRRIIESTYVNHAWEDPRLVRALAALAEAEALLLEADRLFADAAVFSGV